MHFKGMRVRDSRLDVGKFLLLLLVVFGHMIEGQGAKELQGIYRYIYSFHMPAFIFLSGLVASEVLDARRSRRILAVLVIPYVVYQALLPAWDTYLIGKEYRFVLVWPHWVLWYLISLATWRVLLPLLIATGAPILVSVMISLLSPLMPGFDTAWSLGRTAAFLPFFVCGYLYAKEFGIGLPKFSVAPAILALSTLVVVAYLTSRLPVSWLYAASGYETIGLDWIGGLISRVILICAGILGAFGILSLVPNSRVLGWLGQQSLAGFILHAFLLKFISSRSLLDSVFEMQTAMRILVLFCIAFVVTVVCCLVGRLLRVAFDFSWIFGSKDRDGGLDANRSR